jgi:HSP20 family protein
MSKSESLLPSLSLWSKPVFRRFRDDMDGLLENFFKDAFDFRGLSISIFDDIQTDVNFPKVNVADTETNYSVEIAVAGFNKDDVKLELKDDVLFISAQKKEASEEDQKNYIRKEISSRSFQRAVRFPCKINTDTANADYADGIITVRIDKELEKDKECRVPIEVK